MRLWNHFLYFSPLRSRFLHKNIFQIFLFAQKHNNMHLFCNDYLAQKALSVLLFHINFFYRYWNQLNEDMRILLQRFDAETGDEEEKNEESDSTTSFLTQLATWHKQELDEKLASRVQVSQRAVGKIIQVKLLVQTCPN